jgi:hypothetical protein
MVQRPVLNVIQPGTIVDAVRSDGKATSHQLVKERVALVAAVGNAREGGVLPFDTQTGVPHDEHEESRLAFSEAVIDHSLDAFRVRHFQSSSASSP